MIPLFLQSAAQGIESGSDDFTWPLSVFLVSFFVVLGSLLSVGIWQGLATWRARMSIEREAAYMRLAERSVAVEEQTAAHLATLRTELVSLRERTVEVERMLREVG